MIIRVKGLPALPNKIGRAHWAVQAKNKKEWTERVGWLAKVNKPQKPYKHAKIHFHICVASNRRIDPDGLIYAVCKPSLDGLVGVIIEDDTIDNIELSFSFSREGAKGFEIYITEWKKSERVAENSQSLV